MFLSRVVHVTLFQCGMIIISTIPKHIIFQTVIPTSNSRGAPTIPQVVQLHHLLRGGYTPLARGAPPKKREKKWKEERRKRAGKKEKRKEEHRKSGVPLRIGG